VTGLALHLGARLADKARDAAVILGARAELAAAHPRLALRTAVRVLFGGAP
jgi:hypothetical protein